MGPLVLAHGGAAGAALEVAFLLVPVLIFAAISWWAGRRSREEDDGGEPARSESAGNTDHDTP